MSDEFSGGGVGCIVVSVIGVRRRVVRGVSRRRARCFGASVRFRRVVWARGWCIVGSVGEFPCEALEGFANDPEHGDGRAADSQFGAVARSWV